MRGTRGGHRENRLVQHLRAALQKHIVKDRSLEKLMAAVQCRWCMFRQPCPEIGYIRSSEHCLWIWVQSTALIVERTTLSGIRFKTRKFVRSFRSRIVAGEKGARPEHAVDVCNRNWDSILFCESIQELYFGTTVAFHSFDMSFWFDVCLSWTCFAVNSEKRFLFIDYW